MPVVVAPPLIVRPVVCPPPPIVDEANVVSEPVRLSAVPVAFVKKRLPVVKAVEDAYGNCDAATVDDAKKTPWVRMDVVVAAVLVPNELREVNGYAKVEAPKVEALIQLPP